MGYFGASFRRRLNLLACAVRSTRTSCPHSVDKYVDHERSSCELLMPLTDADETTKLSAGQLDKIRRRATGVTIHAIEFGRGPQADRNNFLVRLARENGGRHGYVDVLKFRTGRRP